MARTFHLGCFNCKQYIWIGQSCPDVEFNIYKESKYLKSLEDFLLTHQNHVLMFGEDLGVQEEWVEMENEELMKDIS